MHRSIGALTVQQLGLYAAQAAFREARAMF
jgi:hypothetical protein